MVSQRAPKRRKTQLSLSSDIVTAELLQKFEDFAYASNQPTKRFLTQRSLQRVWNDDILGKFLETHTLALDKEQLVLLRNNHLATLSILVDLRWQDWHGFAKKFLSILRTDLELRDFLPYTIDQAREFFGPQFGPRFYKSQYEYCPIVIRESEHGQHSEGERVPFINPRGTLIADGRYGSVYQETIAPGQYIGADRTTNDEPMVIARKIMSNSIDFNFEIGNLKLFRKGLANHTLVMSYKAFLTVGDEFSILYDLADMDLEMFLHKDDPTKSLSLASLLLASSNLTDALHFLHKGLKLEGSLEQHVCCHRDLKPNNILVFSDPEHFIWKISDFGISSIKSDRRRPGPHPRNAKATPGDLVQDWTNKTTAHRGGGAYLAPEAIYNTSRDVGTHSDIWSFGCILVQILIRGIHDPEYLRQQDELRGFCEDGTTPYPNDYFYRSESTVNPHVLAWLRKLPSTLNGRISRRLAPMCQRLIVQMLNEDATKRPKAEEVQQSLVAMRGILIEDDGHSNRIDSPVRDRSDVTTETGHLSIGTPELSDVELNLIKQYLPAEAIAWGPRRNHTTLVSDEVVTRMSEFLKSQISQLFWVQESVVGRDSTFWPLTECVIDVANEARVALLIHLCQHKPLMGEASRQLALLYSLIFQLLQSTPGNFARNPPITANFHDVLDDTEASFPQAIQILRELLTHTQARYIILLDDFECLVRECPNSAKQVLQTFQECLLTSPTTIKVMITTSGKCEMLMDYTTTNTYVKLIVDPERDTVDLKSKLRESMHVTS